MKNWLNKLITNNQPLKRVGGLTFKDNMSGNEKSGRKPNKTPSFEIRFQLEGRYKKELEKRSDNFETSINHYVKWLVQQDLEK